MTKFRKVARFENGDGAVDVQRTQLEENNFVYMTMPVEGESAVGDLSGAIGVEMITPEIHMVSDPLTGSHLAARAILLHAAYQGNKSVLTLVATTPRWDEDKMADYERLGFTIDMGDTRDKDPRGRKLATEAILISHQNGKRATVELSRQHIRKHSSVDSSIHSGLPDNWRDDY